MEIRGKSITGFFLQNEDGELIDTRTLSREEYKLYMDTLDRLFGFVRAANGAYYHVRDYEAGDANC